MNNVVKYFCLEPEQENYAKTSIPTTFSMQFMTEIVSNKHISQD